MSEREVQLLHKAASDLLSRGEADAANQVHAAAMRIARATPGADLDGLRSGVFQLRVTEEPKPRPPVRSPDVMGED